MKTRSQQNEERRERRNRIIMSLTLIFLMVFSTVAYAFYYFTGDTGVIRYNGHKIAPIVTNGYVQGYTTEVDDRDMIFYTAPEDTLGIALPPGMVQTLRDAEVIVMLFDAQDNQTQYYDALRFDFSETIPNPQASGVTRPSDVYALPVLSCANATAEYPFILFERGNTSVSYRGGCYVLAAEEQGFALLRDRIVYAYHGITEE
jgi:hypothetical protein